MKNKPELITSICKEIAGTEHFRVDEVIETIYIGGGTPSLLSEEELQNILESIRNKFIISQDAEITLEANPDDISPEVMDTWKQKGINRLSVGLQSFNEAELKWMNRAHSATQALRCIDEMTAAGFSNFSVDLIYGSPLQSDDDLKKNFEIIAQKNVPHISCYALTVEPKTALAKMIDLHKTAPTDPDKQASQFSILLKLMEDAGYEQYEISNFSKPGFRSRHNSSYWQGKSYYGFGPGAHSFDGSTKRKWNIANNARYIQSIDNGLIPFEEEVLTESQRMNEYIMTSLRTAEGLHLGYIKEHFGEENVSRILDLAGKYVDDGKIIRSTDILQLTKNGKFLADGIAADLFI